MEFSDIWSIKTAVGKPVASSISWRPNDMGEDGEEVSNYFSYMDPSATRSDYKNLRDFPHLRNHLYAETRSPDSEAGGWSWLIRGGGESSELFDIGHGFKNAEQAKAAASEALQKQHEQMLASGWIHLDDSGKIVDPEHPYHFPEPQSYMCTNCENYITERPDRFDFKTSCPSCGQVGSFISDKSFDDWNY